MANVNIAPVVTVLQLIQDGAHLPMIHKVEDGDHVGEPNPPEEDHWLRMRILLQHDSEQRAAG